MVDDVITTIDYSSHALIAVNTPHAAHRFLYRSLFVPSRRVQKDISLRSSSSGKGRPSISELRASYGASKRRDEHQQQLPARCIYAII